MAEVAKRLINVDEYHKMASAGILTPDDRVELIHGEIFEMSPIGSKHGAVVKKINSLLNKLFDNEVLIGIQDPVRIDEKNEPEPDVSILKNKPDYYSSAHPGAEDILCIIEVSDSSIVYDREVKGSIYATANIPEYWIIDIDKKLIEVYTDPVKNAYSSKKVCDNSMQITLLNKVIKAKDLLV